jgi:hypothetical protein
MFCKEAMDALAPRLQQKIFKQPGVNAILSFITGERISG